jgi:hypothetical protein
MPIRPLAEILVDHPYFASGQFAGAAIAPDAATDMRLRGLRVIAKARPGGLGLFVDLGDDNKPRVAVPDNTRLRFELARPPVEVVTATDLSAIGPDAVFTDDGVAAGTPLKLINRPTRAGETVSKAAGAQTLTLSGRPVATALPADFKILAPAAGVAVSGYDAPTNRVTLTGPAGPVSIDYPVASPARPDLLAPIEIGIGSDTVTKAATGTPRRVSVPLAPVAARWVYHLVTNLPNPLADWTIKNGNGSGPAMAFGTAGTTEITAAASDDPFGADLAGRSTPLRVLRFVSDAPVPASEAVARRVALFAGTQQLFPALPNPSPSTLRMIAGAPAFGAILRFVTA